MTGINQADNLIRVSEILLVEDTDTDAKQAEAMLKRLGIKNPVRRLLDGQEAMYLLTNLAEDPSAMPPSVIFLGLRLPYVTGFEILKWMQDKPVFQKSLKIVFGTLDDLSTIKNVYFLGANSFLNKPITPQELCEVVESFPQYWLIDDSRQRSKASQRYNATL